VRQFAEFHRPRQPAGETVLRDIPNMTGCEVYACGSVGMAETAHSAFLQKAMISEAIFIFTSGYTCFFFYR
jgi:hypothetical protein